MKQRRDATRRDATRRDACTWLLSKSVTPSSRRARCVKHPKRGWTSAAGPYHHAAVFARVAVDGGQLLFATFDGTPGRFGGVFRGITRWRAGVAVEGDMDALARHVLHAGPAQRTHHARRILFIYIIRV